MYDGKAAIHMAVIESYLPIVRLLIEYNANLDIKVGHKYIVYTHTRKYTSSVHLRVVQKNSIYTSSLPCCKHTVYTLYCRVLFECVTNRLHLRNFSGNVCLIIARICLVHTYRIYYYIAL